MSCIPRWQFDEMAPPGLDYRDPAIARAYDGKHQQFRDYGADTQEIMVRLGLGPNDRVIDMGAGTGAFTLHAAKHVREVYAVDVSEAMLSELRRKVGEAGLTNTHCLHGGFLTYEHEADPVDAMVSIAALHHLPDFWKLIGLKRAAGTLKPGGRLFISDAVFHFDPADHASRIEAWINWFGEAIGPEFAAEAEMHVRQEFSTCDWIMDGLLERAGFTIHSVRRDAFHAKYVCIKAEP